MSAEESDKRKPLPKGLERALANLARVVVRRNLDPGPVLVALQRALIFKRDVWPTLTPEQKREVLATLQRLRNDGSTPPKGRARRFRDG